MKRRNKVELFEEIRREYEFGVGTISGVAKKFNVHRRMVREAIKSALPAPRKTPQRSSPKLDLVRDFIDQILEADLKSPRKQRHTGHRIFVRLAKEVEGCDISERRVREYVQDWKLRHATNRCEVFVPQVYQLGVEAQVDWYEAVAEINGERLTVQVFNLRSMASGAAFHRAYLHATQQAFLDGHQRAFHYYGGVFRRLRPDYVPRNIIRENIAGNAAQIGEGVDVSSKEVLQALIKEELEIEGPAVGEREDEAGEAAARATDAEFSERSPIDLSLLTGQNRKAKESLSGDRAQLSHRPSQLEDVSLISTVAQHLEKAGGSQPRVLFESLLDEIQKWVRRKRL